MSLFGRYHGRVSEGVVVNVRVTVRASGSEVAGWQDDVLRVRLQAPPVEGRANLALRRLLAEKLDLAARDIEVITGATGRTKRVLIQRLGLEEVRERLGL